MINKQVTMQSLLEEYPPKCLWSVLKLVYFFSRSREKQKGWCDRCKCDCKSSRGATKAAGAMGGPDVSPLQLSSLAHSCMFGYPNCAVGLCWPFRAVQLLLTLSQWYYSWEAYKHFMNLPPSGLNLTWKMGKDEWYNFSIEIKVTLTIHSL